MFAGEVVEIGVRRALLKIAARQDGIITVGDALAAGFTRRQFEYARKGSDWPELQSGTYATFVTHPTFRQRLRAAYLAAGPEAAVGGAAAAELMKWDGFRGGEVVIVLPFGRKPTLRAATVHVSRDFDEADLWNVAGFRTTKAARTLVDLALTSSVDQLTTALNGLARNGGSEKLQELREELKQFSPNRSHIILKILRDRIWQSAGPESPLETPVLRILREAGFAPTAQYRLREGNRIVKRFDAAFPDKQVGVESDGFSTHGGPLPFHKDAEQQLKAQAMGWQVIRMTTAMVEHPDLLVKAVQLALSRVESPAFEGKMPTEQLDLLQATPNTGP